MEKHLRQVTVFKGTSKIIQNELLNIMFDVCRAQIKEEVKCAVMSDDTTDISDSSQNVVFRYLVDNKVVEQFWSFSELSTANSEQFWKEFSCVLVSFSNSK